MKILKIFVVSLFFVAFGSSTILAQANQESSSSSTIKKRSEQDKKDKNENPGVTPRMESFYQHTPVSEADLTWMRVIYRSLDLNKEKNQPLYYPEEPLAGEENLFFVIMHLLANNQIPAFDYLDGKEIFTDQYRVKVKDVLDRFHILYSEAKGSTDKNPKFKIEDSDIPSNEVKSYYILERWEFDRNSNKMKTRIEAICPVLHRSGDFGEESVKYPMFWVKFDALRPTLSQQYVFTDNDNNLARYSLDDYFNLGMYEGDIYKTRNLKNLSMMQMYSDPDDLKRAQDSIDNRLNNYAKNLWVPTREELAAKAKTQPGGSNEVQIESRDVKVSEEKESRTTSKRGQTTSKQSQTKVKQSKPKSSSSNATKSVRRRK